MTLENARYLLTVTDALPARTAGVLLMPRIEAEKTDRSMFRVVLRLPNVPETLETSATFDFPHVMGPSAPRVVLRLPELSPESIPIGTEVWRLG
jgi:hypothetical protein